MSITLKTPEDITKLRKAGKILAAILDELEAVAVPGNKTIDIDDRAMELIEEHGVEPMILGYDASFANRPYPAATCVSLNDVVVHGIPNEQPEKIKDGDVVSIDLVIGYEGVIVDSARTVIAGEGSEEAKALLAATKESLKAGIAAAVPGARVFDIGKAIERSVPRGIGIVRDFCGHGVGYALHEEPQIPNFTMKGESAELVPGMVLAIEPMLTAGKPDVFVDSGDGYTVFTQDGSLAAHMEHTVLITDKGPEILTIQ